MSSKSTTDEKAEVSNGASEHEYEGDIEAMPDPEFWQRIALEAIVNDDPAKALALRVESYFADATCLPRQRDTLRVIGVSNRVLFEWMITSNFEVETIEEERQGLLVRGIEYSQFGDEFSAASETDSDDKGV